MKNKFKIYKIEEIQPLTIVSMKYNSKVVILNCKVDNEMVLKVQNEFIPSENLFKWLEKTLDPIIFGVGNNINEAFENYKEKYYK